MSSCIRFSQAIKSFKYFKGLGYTQMRVFSGATNAENSFVTTEILSRHASAKGERNLNRTDHNSTQAEFFDNNVDFFLKEIPEDVEKNLEKIVGSANLDKDDTVLDCGAGSGALIPHFRNLGITTITAIDLSLSMISELKQKFDGVRCWHGDIVDMPGEFGPFDVIFFNAMFGNVHNQEDTLKAAIRLSKIGSRIVISHPLGYNFVENLKLKSPQIVPHSLPSKEILQNWSQNFGLEVICSHDEEELYLSVLKVTQASKKFLEETYYFWKAPLFLSGPVVYGFGRGSRKMGIPTANLPPENLEKELQGVEKGVYFGFCQVPEISSDVIEMVMNVGKRPTFVDGDGLSVEVHVLRKFKEDFYGKTMKALVLGFIRPEMKFSSLEELVERINKDINITTKELSTLRFQEFSSHHFFNE